jgi:signal transduction histidine kinase
MGHVVRGNAVSSNHSTNWDAGPRVRWVAFGVGFVAFVATEFMHFLLVPDIGRRWERLLAEGVSAVVVAVLTSRLMRAANQRREAALLRMQVISEMNHHIRNSLAAISLSTDEIQNQHCIRVISESVDRIEWALREILLRNKPLQEEELAGLRYFQAQGTSRRSTYTDQENTND